jgi:hypothetical protein
MNDFWRWLFGIKQSPDLVEGGVWQLRCQALPEGGWAVAGVAAAIAAVALVWWLYRIEGRTIGPAMRSLMAVLRLVALTCVACMLVELVLVIVKKELVPSQLLVLIDDSESMGLKDPYADSDLAERTVRGMAEAGADNSVERLRQQTRSELARRAVSELAGPLSEDRQLAIYRFAGDLESIDGDKLAGLRAAGTTSALGDALKGALAAHRGQPLAGVLVVSDGQSNAGEDVRKVAEQAGRDGVTVHALAVGTEQGPSNARLVDLEISPVVFVRDPTEISVLFESRGLTGHSGIVTLDQRHDSGAWTELARDEVTFGQDAVLGRLTFKFTPEATGQYDFRARISDAGPELTDSDNALTKTVKVVRQRVRALLIAGSPAPEVQFLRNALLRDTALEFASWLQSAGEGYEHIGHRPIRRLPANLQELSQYDVVILFDPDVQALGANWSEMLQKFVGSAGGGLIFVAGELHSQQLLSGGEAAATGGVDRSWLRVLPVVSEPGLYQSTADVRLSSRESWTLELTPEGDSDPIFRFADQPSHNREVLASLPGMFWHCPVTRAKPAATVLAHHGDPRMRNSFGRHVLMATQRYGPGRTVFIGFDSTYRWRYLHEEYFDGFWARLIDRVGRSKALGGRYPFTLATDKSTYRPGDRVLLRADWIQSGDDASPASELRGEVEAPSGDPISIELEPQPNKEGSLETSFAVDQPGPYLVRVVPTVAATGGEETALRPATLSFRVEPRSQELDKATLDRALLEDMTRAAGGQVVTLADNRRIPEAFKIKRVERVLEYRDELWDAPVWFGLLVVVLTAEWLLRKRCRMA